MKALMKYWKVLLALILAAAALYLYFGKYQTEKAAYELQTKSLETMIVALEGNIRENMKYAEVQDDLDDARAKVQASRMKLYNKFPKELREEDQIMYVLYLETLFDTEIFFEFGEVADITALQDGSVLQGLLITVNYQTTYDGFKEMVDYLATDSRITSVYQATIEYDAQRDIAAGQITLVLYMVDTDAQNYLPPDVAVPDTGKDNIFE